MNTTEKTTNTLIKETSPYLLQHAYNPVDWFPWGDEAFAKAKDEDKPIFLSIGYSTCHWCHVMERESFENTKIAELLNRNFICVKVDREERPDIDHVYMEVCQRLTGSGGWPLSVFLTPEKMPFYAGTYLPPFPRYGSLGFSDVLTQINDMWRNSREKIISACQSIMSEINSAGETSLEPDENEIRDTLKMFKGAFDERYGGFGTAPKFPCPHNLLFLMNCHHVFDDKTAMNMYEKTLLSMYKGGIYDHIGFGFCRYSTDEKWLVPHFEKMLYDNALLALAYTDAYKITKNRINKMVAEEILQFMLRELYDPEKGVFYTALDADTAGVEGKTILWTKKEVLSVLGAEGKKFCEVYDITTNGNFEHLNIPNLIGKEISEGNLALKKERERLLFERSKREQPFLDTKVLTSLNGMAAVAFAAASRAFEKEEYLDIAVKNVEFVLDKAIIEGRLMSSCKGGQGSVKAFSADYAYLILALTELCFCGKTEYLEYALRLNDDLIKLFWDKENGGLFISGNDTESMIVSPKDFYDGAVPCANSVAAMNFARLSLMAEQDNLDELTDRMFSAAGSYSGMSKTFMLCARLMKINGTKVTLAGAKRDEYIKMKKLLFTEYLPFTVICFEKDRGSEPLAYVCGKHNCYPPVGTARELENLLGKL